MIIKCEYCQKEFEVSPSRLKNKHICCCRKCSLELARDIRFQQIGFLNCICPICNTKFHLKAYEANNGATHCCSRECSNKWRSQKMTGEGNHQYGLTGNKNSSWKSDVKINAYGYRMIRKPEHPYADVDGFVFEHRLIVEEHWLTPFNSVEINGQMYLAPEYEVHHIDGDKLNNLPENLFILTKSFHRTIHNLENPHPRDANGRFTAYES